MTKSWKFVFKNKADKDFKALDIKVQKQVMSFMTRLEMTQNPRSLGESLKGDKRMYWRYRVGDYRMLCIIHDHVFEIYAIRIGHRRHIYTK